MELTITFLALVIELALFLFCRAQLRRPVDVTRPRLIPYNAVMIVVGLAALATLAHLISLLTGHQIAPRRPRGMG